MSLLLRRDDEEKPLVSVIVPAYNAAATIERTLDSALNQTYREVEVIVVDDGSEDQTAAIVRSVGERDSRVLLLCQPNQGVATARNLALAHATGTFVAPLDADDMWFPEKLERQVHCMIEGGPSVGLVYTWWIALDEEGALLSKSAQWDLSGRVYDALVYINFIGNASVPLMRRACIEQVGGYDAQLKARGAQGCEDWDLTLRIAERYELRVVPAYLSGYRVAVGSMSFDCSSMGASYDLVLDDVRKRHPEIPLWLYRGARSRFYIYLRNLSYRTAQYRSALYWCGRAVAADPLLLLSPQTVADTLKVVLRGWAEPMAVLSAPVHRAWRTWRGRGGEARPPLSIEQAGKKRGRPTPPSWTWRSWKPYDWISAHRWRKVEERLKEQEAEVGLAKEQSISATGVPSR